jgi:hypothetical protein
MNKTTCSQGQHNSSALKRIFKSSSKLIRCSEKMKNKQKQFIIHHKLKAFEKKMFLRGRSNFFQGMVSNYWAWETKRKGRKKEKRKNKFNSMKSCVLFYDSEICQKTPKVLYLLVIFYSCFYLNFKANFVIMASELWFTLEQVLCTFSMGAKSL